MSGGRFEHVALIGIGLIGSSLCHAMRRAELAGRITGHARSEATRAKALELGLVEKVFESAAEAVRGADLVIMCVPISACGPIAGEIGPALKPGAILTDVGSVKSAIVHDVGPHVPAGVHFIPGHPIAGTEHSGPESGFAELFDNRWTILTPAPGADGAAVEKLKTFWQACGSSVEIMTAEHHDLVLAITSHLPHLVAYTIVGTADDLATVTESEVIKFSAGGFRDSTRIAASDPTMWRDVFLNNKEAVLETLGRFSEELAMLQKAIRWGDGETLFNFFARSRRIRRGIVAAGQDTASAELYKLRSGKSGGGLATGKAKHAGGEQAKADAGKGERRRDDGPSSGSQARGGPTGGETDGKPGGRPPSGASGARQGGTGGRSRRGRG